jgi:hypothetical protein
MALFARKIRPAHVPHTGFPEPTNSLNAGNFRKNKKIIIKEKIFTANS